MDERTRHLLTAEPLPLLARMALPNSVAFLMQSCVSMTEVWLIGQLGTVSLAAIALVFPMLMLTQTLSTGALGGAVSSAIARAYGAGNKQRAQQLMWHALLIAAAGGLLLLFIFLLAGREFLMFLGGRGEVLELAMSYCLILFLGGVGLWLMGVTSALYRGVGNMQFPARMMFINALIQVPFSACLILGLAGLPQLGVAGAAISAVTTGSLIAVLMLLRLWRGKEPIQLDLSCLKFEGEMFRDIFKVALPASLSPLLTIATIISLTAIVGRFGPEALAGYGIGSRIEFLLIPLVFGLGASMTALVGMSIGAENIQRAERVGWAGGAAAAGVAGFIGLVLALLPDYWIPLFTTEPATFAAAKMYFQWVGPCFAFQGLGLSLYFASQGASAMFWPIAATVLRVLVVVGGALLLTKSFDMGLQGVYLAAGVGMVLYGIVIALSLKLGAWRH
ncbi:MAG: MATE family efflux transporter [Pseudomonadales bacterium]|nr:MATE family efflux transporter [Pseudomonadales bacterium]